MRTFIIPEKDWTQKSTGCVLFHIAKQLNLLPLSDGRPIPYSDLRIALNIETADYYYVNDDPDLTRDEKKEKLIDLAARDGFKLIFQ